MKRRIPESLLPIIVPLILVITIIVLVCLGASSGPKTETIQSESIESTIGSNGNYYLFRTEDVQEYFKFLENFDEINYEIIDISTSLRGYNRQYGSDEFYIVTYKSK